MKDLIGQMSLERKMSIYEIAEKFQKFLNEEGLAEKFKEKTFLTSSTKLTYEELERRCGLEPFQKWHTARLAENEKTEVYQKECQGLRQSGRSTRILLKAMLAADQGKSVTVYAPSHGMAKKLSMKCEELLEKAGFPMIWNREGKHLTVVSGSGCIFFPSISEIGNFHKSVSYFDESLNDL